MPPLLHCLDILFLLERPRWRQSGKPQLSLNNFFNFLVPEDWVFLTWLEARQFMRSWILLFWFICAIMETWSLGWMSDLGWLPRALESERKFPWSCWNHEPEAKIYSSLSSFSIPSRVTLWQDTNLWVSVSIFLHWDKTYCREVVVRIKWGKI